MCDHEGAPGCHILSCLSPWFVSGQCCRVRQMSASLWWCYPGCHVSASLWWCYPGCHVSRVTVMCDDVTLDVEPEMRRGCGVGTDWGTMGRSGLGSWGNQAQVQVLATSWHQVLMGRGGVRVLWDLSIVTDDSMKQYCITQKPQGVWLSSFIYCNPNNKARYKGLYSPWPYI